MERSELSIHKTMEELDVRRSTISRNDTGAVYRWYQRYRKERLDGLNHLKPRPRRFWNRIPDIVCDQVVRYALQNPDKSPRQLAWHVTDTDGYCISESSVYRILKGFDLVTGPAFQMGSAREKHEKPTRRLNELRQTDFTYLKALGWGWHYLSSVLDDYSRYILAWKLCKTMSAGDVQDTHEMGLSRTDLGRVGEGHCPRLLSDNGPCYLSGEPKRYLQRNDIDHVRGAPYHPMTLGEIERYHRSMKNVIKLRNHEYPWKRETAIRAFVEYYKRERYHESLDNLTPEDVYFGRAEEIKRAILRYRRKWNLGFHGQWRWTTNTRRRIFS